MVDLIGPPLRFIIGNVMDTNNMEIRGRSFRTKADYARGWHDNRIIERIEENLDKTDLNQILELKKELDNGKYKFESLVGEDYIDEISDLLKELENQKDSTDTKTRKVGRGFKGKEKTKTERKSLEDYDKSMQAQIVKELRKAQRRRSFLLFILALCIMGSVGYLLYYFSLYQKNETEYNELASLVKEDEGGTVTINYEEQKDRPPILKKYEALYNKNKKIIGWLTIKGCDIDYPVMQTGDNEYYLEHNYNQEYDKNGSLFLDKDCDPAFPNDNMIIYGHHMKSGRMFGKLNYYLKESFWEENKEFTFDTIYETGTYAVMFAFKSKIYNEDEIVFKYYQFIDASSEEEFYSNMSEMKQLSLYDTGVTATYGDRLITLSTCDSSEAYGRFVVVAKKVR